MDSLSNEQKQKLVKRGQYSAMEAKVDALRIRGRYYPGLEDLSPLMELQAIKDLNEYGPGNFDFVNGDGIKQVLEEFGITEGEGTR